MSSPSSFLFNKIKEISEETSPSEMEESAKIQKIKVI